MCIARIIRSAAFLALCVAGFVGVAAIRVLAATSDAAPSLVQHMAGTWSVTERMWPSPGAAPIALAPVIARRRLVGGAFLQEIMEPVAGANDAAFTRIAYLDYNVVDRQYEYFSLDTRAPQMMIEKSTTIEARGTALPGGTLDLYGGTFVAPRWGGFVDTAFRYRLVIGDVEAGRQVVQLYLTPLSATAGKEFLAFQYVYTRRR